MKIEYPYSVIMPGLLVSLMRLTHRPVTRCHVYGYSIGNIDRRQEAKGASCSAVLDRCVALPQCQIYQRGLSTLTTFHFHQARGHTDFITQESSAEFTADLHTNCLLFLYFHHDAAPFRACASWIR